MQKYHKIQSIFYRDPENNFKTFIEGKFSDPAYDILQNVPWDFSEKVDGTNIRVGWSGGAVKFGGRTDRAELPGQLRIHLEKTFTEELMSGTFQGEGSITLIGEGFGGKIQKMSKTYGDEQRFILFDVFVEPCENHPLGIWLERENVADIAATLNIPVVPVFFTAPLMQGYLKLKEFPDYNSLISEAGLPSEGFVARPQVELRNRFGSRVITKIKGRDFTSA